MRKERECVHVRATSLKRCHFQHSVFPPIKDTEGGRQGPCGAAITFCQLCSHKQVTMALSTAISKEGEGQVLAWFKALQITIWAKKPQKLKIEKSTEL